MTARGTRVSALAALLITSLALAACGDLEDTPSDGASRGDLTSGISDGSSKPEPQLPPRPSGQVQVDGQLAGSLTGDVKSSFDRQSARSGLAVDVIPAANDETEGFANLCAGRTDVVDASRRITPDELKGCTHNGLQVVDFEIAYDATVIVTRNERDVGADCVNFDQLRSMFAAATPVSAWNQVNENFFPIQLTTTGPEQGATDFTFFGQRVLGVAEPTLADFRSDYVPFARESQIKNEIAGGKDEPGGAPPGRVGIIGFSYYELYEDKLRPLEIDGQAGDRCVFPSEETISSELYPLERTLRLYTTQRSLDRQEVQAFMTYYLKQSESLATANELVPIDQTLRRQELDRVTDPGAYGTGVNGQVSEAPGATVSSSAAATGTTTVPGTPSGSGVDSTTSTGSTTTEPAGG